MSTAEKELVEKGVSMLRGVARTRNAGDISAVDTLIEAVPGRRQGIRDIGR